MLSSHLKLRINRYGARNMIPPKNPQTARKIPKGLKLFLQANHVADRIRKPIKSVLNCPGHVIAAISPKNIGNRFHPLLTITIAV